MLVAASARTADAERWSATCSRVSGGFDPVLDLRPPTAGGPCAGTTAGRARAGPASCRGQRVRRFGGRRRPPEARARLGCSRRRGRPRPSSTSQRDATVADLRRAVGAGLRSVEHVKRYTTIGTGPTRARPRTSTRSASRPSCSASDAGDARHRPRSGRRTRRSRSRRSPAATAATCSTPCARRRSTTGTSRTARCSRTSASGSGPGTIPRDGEDMDAAVLRECAAVREARRP